jgi:hypothetical protein
MVPPVGGWDDMAEPGGAAICIANSPWLALKVPASHIQQALESPDAIHLAGELGRLDVVSIFLAGLGIFIGIVALGGFWMVRRAAMNSAGEAAKVEVSGVLPGVLPAALIEILAKRPDLIGSALRQDPSILLSVLPEARETMFGDIDAGEAEEIAETIGEDKKP